jgi:GNAT superfamily N-acetyltransferase
MWAAIAYHKNSLYNIFIILIYNANGKEEKMKADPHLRFFRSNDLAALQRLIFQTIDFSYHAVYPDEAIQYFKDYHSNNRILDDASMGNTLIILKSNILLGTGTLCNSSIRRVFVSPDCQGQGLGKLIMSSLEQIALSHRETLLSLEASLPSQVFYHHMGYQTIEKCFIEVGNNQSLDYFRMQKALA